MSFYLFTFNKKDKIFENKRNVFDKNKIGPCKWFYQVLLCMLQYSYIPHEISLAHCPIYGEGGLFSYFFFLYQIWMTIL